MEDSDIPYTERELIQRAISIVILDASEDKDRGPVPVWALVEDIFETDASVSKLICYRYGFDPHKMVVPFRK